MSSEPVMLSGHLPSGAPPPVRPGAVADAELVSMVVRTVLIAAVLVLGYFVQTDGEGWWRNRNVIVLGLGTSVGLAFGRLRGTGPMWMTGGVAIAGVVINAALYDPARAWEITYVISHLVVASLFLSGRVSLVGLGLNTLIIALLLIAKNLSPTVGTEGMEFFKYNSRNMASWLILCPTVLYYAECVKRGRRYAFWPAALCLVVCILYEGRGGILSALVLFAGLVAHRVAAGRRVSTLVPLVFTLGVLGFVSWEYRDLFEERLSHFEATGLESMQRVEMWQHYFLSLHGVQWFSGADLEADGFWGVYGHTHNAWLQGHSHYGPGGILIFLLFVAVTAAALWRRSVLAVLLLAVGSRISTDAVAFTDPYDFVIWILLAMGLQIAWAGRRAAEDAPSRAEERSPRVAGQGASAGEENGAGPEQEAPIPAWVRLGGRSLAPRRPPPVV